MDNELAIPQTQMQHVSQPPTVEALIQLAIERNVPIETMEKLMAMHERLQAQRAKAEFIAAMAAFQGECPEISKTKSVPDKYGNTAYKYAPLESVVKQVGELLTRHGFSYRHEMKLRDGGVLVLCHVTHIGGHCEVTPMDVPFGTKTMIMSDSQQVAAATTFAKRYAFLSAFGIMTADADNDGADLSRAQPKEPQHEQREMKMDRLPEPDKPVGELLEYTVLKVEEKIAKKSGNPYAVVTMKLGDNPPFNALYFNSKLNDYTGPIRAIVGSTKDNKPVVEHAEFISNESTDWSQVNDDELGPPLDFDSLSPGD